MKAPVKPGWCLADADRECLRGLVAAVDVNGEDDDPEFIRLLEAWETARAPWNLTPTVCAYHCRDGWLTAGVVLVLDAITVHLERRTA